MQRAFPQTCRHYEANGIILLEDSGIAYDAAFVRSVSFPKEWKKIGTINGITDSCMTISGGQLVRTNNPLADRLPDDRMLLKLHSELVRLELGFKLLVATVFPSYSTVHWINCTFRFTRSENEPAHLDSFDNGSPREARARLPRVKFFLNVDAAPRVWNIGPALPDILRASAGSLGHALPRDLNSLCHLVNSSGILSRMPVERIEIPPRGAVFANGATVLHTVVYGERMVALEGLLPPRALQPTSVSEWEKFPDWVTQAGYSLEPAGTDAAAST